MINNTGFFGSNIRCMFSIYIFCFQTQMMFPNYPRGYFLVQKVCERVLGTWLYMHETVVLVHLALMRGFWDYHRESVLEKKSIIFTAEVKDETNKIKIICGDKVSVKLFYDNNFRWHMPLCEEICRAEQ